MQNRYVGDVGDFGKYGLLRAVVNPLRLGVVWYLHPDESHNFDGKYTGYLNGTAANQMAFRACDPPLYDALQRLVVKDDRHISRVSDSGILPNDTTYFEKSLSFSRKESRLARQAARANWLEGALSATESADVVFCDPDNGISETVDPLRKNGPKYVFVEDLMRFVGRGQSLIIYHHLGRRGSAVEQIRCWIENLRSSLNLSCSPLALWYHRGTARVYFVAMQESHRSILESRLALLLSGFWVNHFELVD